MATPTHQHTSKSEKVENKLRGSNCQSKLASICKNVHPPAGGDLETPMWGKLQQGLNDLSKATETAIQDVTTEADHHLNHVVVQCQSCHTNLKMPRDQAVFQCGVCGTVVQAPALGDKATYHLNRAVSFVSSEADKGIFRATHGYEKDAQVTMQVIVPSNSKPGSSMTFSVPDGRQFTVQIPGALTETSIATGQAAFNVKIPPAAPPTVNIHAAPARPAVVNIPIVAATEIPVSTAVPALNKQAK